SSSSLSLFSFLMLLLPPCSTLFPYTTLFRSLLAATGGILGIVFASWGSHAIVSFVSNNQPRPLTFATGLDLRVLGFTGAVSLLRSEEHTSELQSRGHLVCRLLLEKKKNNTNH